MKIYVDSMERLFEKIIRVHFEGEFSYGETFCKYAEYNKEGKMVNCDSGTSMQNPLYYIEVAEVYKKMLELEGAIAKDFFEKTRKVQSYYIDMRSKLIEDRNFHELRRIYDNVCYEKLQFIKRLKRLRNEDSIKECNEKIEELNKMESDIGTEITIINKEVDELYYLERQKIRELVIN